MQHPMNIGMFVFSFIVVAALIIYSILKCSSLQVTTNSSAPVSSISLFTPAQPRREVNLAVGRVSGSLETWILDLCSNKVENSSECHAHDRVVKFHCNRMSFLSNKIQLIVNTTIGDRFIMGFRWPLFIQLQSGALTCRNSLIIPSDCGRVKKIMKLCPLLRLLVGYLSRSLSSPRERQYYYLKS